MHTTEIAAAAAEVSSSTAPETKFTLADLPKIGAPMEGGKYAGILTNDDGQPYVLVLLDAKPSDRLAWQAASDWALSLGAALPNRVESAQLFRVLKGEFEAKYHWTCERDSSGAWVQDFGGGGQDWDGVDDEGCARAVRRFVL